MSSVCAEADRRTIVRPVATLVIAALEDVVGKAALVVEPIPSGLEVWRRHTSARPVRECAANRNLAEARATVEVEEEEEEEEEEDDDEEEEEGETEEETEEEEDGGGGDGADDKCADEEGVDDALNTMVSGRALPAGETRRINCLLVRDETTRRRAGGGTGDGTVLLQLGGGTVLLQSIGGGSEETCAAIGSAGSDVRT